MEAGFLQIINMSITAGYVILAVMIIRLFLRKAPVKYSYMLWSVVAFRLSMPFSFHSVFSLFNLNMFKASVTESTTGIVMQYVPGNIGIMEQQQVNLGLEATNQVINNALPQGTSANSVNPMQVAITVGMWIWVLGIAFLAVYSMVTYFRLQKRMENAVLLEKNIFQSDRVQSPFIMGFVEPKIYIPFGLDENALRYVLTHEGYHLKRGDHLIKLFAFLLLTVHWFNPLCWMAYSLMCKDMEMSCDEKVLSGEENIRKAYSMTLLSFATNRRFPVPSPLCFGETGVKARIKNVLNWKKPKVWVSFLAAVLCIVTVIGCAGNPEEGEQWVTNAEEILEGYTAKETEAIYAKLDELVKYKSSEDFSDTAEIWIGATNSDEGYYVGMMILRDAVYKGLDYKSDIKSLEMDGTRWLSVTCRAIVEGENGDELYKEDDFELLIPVTVDGAGGVTFGNITGEWHCSHEPVIDEEDNTGENNEVIERVYSSYEADVTHDGVPDHIVVFGATLEGLEMEDDVEVFFSKAFNWGYIRVYDGSDATYDAFNPGASTPIWEGNYSMAHAGNGQLSIAEIDGLEYLICSSMWEGQGRFDYHFEVFSLDNEGRIYMVEEYSVDIALKEENGFELSDEQKQELAAFREQTLPFYEGAYLLIALDISEGAYVSDTKQTYYAEEYYNSVWERCTIGE